VDSTGGLTQQRVWLLFAISLGALFVALPSVPRFVAFSPDAWTVYELGRTVGGDFFRANTVREFVTGSTYSSSFAPLWPVIVSVFSRITGNIYGGYLAAFLAYAGFAAAAELFARRAFGQRGIGVLSALLMLQFRGLQEELSSGRSIPFALFVLALLGVLLIGLQAAPVWRSAVVGLLAGALAMTRFDAIPAALAVVLGAPLIGLSRARLAMLVAGFAVAVSPWVAYSLTHFHTIFASDNRVVALAVDRMAFVHDFHVRPQLTLFDAPWAWLAKVLRNSLTIAHALLRSIRETLFLPLLLLLALVHAYRSGTPPTRRELDPRMREIALFTIVAMAPLTGYVATGYWDHRYFSAVLWLTELFLLAYVTRRYSRAVVLALALAGSLLSVATLWYATQTSPLSAMRREIDRTQVDRLEGCLRRAGGTPTDAVVFAGRDVTSRYKFGALTGWRVLPLPSNWERLGRLERDEFLRRYAAVFVVDSGPSPTIPIALHTKTMECGMPLQKIARVGP
jgi:hypothetical protein